MYCNINKIFTHKVNTSIYTNETSNYIFTTTFLHILHKHQTIMPINTNIIMNYIDYISTILFFHNTIHYTCGIINRDTLSKHNVNIHDSKETVCK